jgi:hypothetical protein
VLIVFAGVANADPEIKTLELCEGVYGPARAKAVYPVLSEYCARLKVTGLKVDAEQKHDLTIEVTLRNAARIAVDTLRMEDKSGGDSTQGHFLRPIPPIMAPGNYTLVMTVRDNLAVTEATKEIAVGFTPIDFSLESPRVFFDVERKVPGSNHVAANQMFIVTCGLLGYDCSQGKCHVMLTWRLLDGNGQVISKLHEETFKEDDARVLMNQIPARGYWRAVRIDNAGSYVIEVAATDVIANKTASLRVPVTVREP